MIVVDACAWVHALVMRGAIGDSAREVLARDGIWVAPAHMPVEVLRTIQRAHRSGDLTDEQAERSAAEVVAAEIEYAVPHRALLAHAWSIRKTVNLYDAPYVSLALELGVPLVTADVRLARAARSLGVEAVVPGDAD